MTPTGLLPAFMELNFYQRVNRLQVSCPCSQMVPASSSLLQLNKTSVNKNVGRSVQMPFAACQGSGSSAPCLHLQVWCCWSASSPPVQPPAPRQFSPHCCSSGAAGTEVMSLLFSSQGQSRDASQGSSWPSFPLQPHFWAVRLRAGNSSHLLLMGWRVLFSVIIVQFLY